MFIRGVCCCIQGGAEFRSGSIYLCETTVPRGSWLSRLLMRLLSINKNMSAAIPSSGPYQASCVIYGACRVGKRRIFTNINLSNLLYPNFRELSPSWETNRPSAGQEIPPILWNPKVPYRIHKRLPPIRILSQSKPVRGSPTHLLNMYFNIIISALLFCPKHVWIIYQTARHNSPEENNFSTYLCSYFYFT